MIPPVPPRAHAIIPARYASTRFPGKPLFPLCGKPMFWHTWFNASRCPDLASVTLATDDERIENAARELGVPVIRTAGTHESGTDRVHEAARLLAIPDDAVVVNVQGDEPAINPDSISLLLTAFAGPFPALAATLAYPLKESDMGSPDKVKVVRNAAGDALYFSRAPIPFARDGRFAHPPLGHVGLYAFTMRTLERFVGLVPSPLERTEKLEQLRLLENSIPLRVLLTDSAAVGVDTEEDAARVLSLLRRG